MSNPIAAAFMIEALVLVGTFAYLLTRCRVNHVSWRFVLLSLLGSMAFALPVVLLWPRRARGPAEDRLNGVTAGRR